MVDLELLSDFWEFLKEKKVEGKKIIAFMAHDNIPEELIDAAGFFPLNLIFAGNDDVMNASHDYLPPSTCSFAQSCIGLFSIKPNGFNFLDLIDYFVVSNHCVLNICASEIISKYFSIPRLNFYISYTQDANASDYYRLELVEFKKQLEEIKGSEILEEEISKSIAKYNNFKKKLSDIDKMKVSGNKKLKIFQKAMLYGPDFIPDLDNFIQDNQQKESQSTNNSKNLLLTGCSIFIGDYLIDLVEESGGNIVFFDTWVGNSYFCQVFEEDTLNSILNPIELLVLRFKMNHFGDHSVPFYLENKVSQIENIIKDYQQKTGKKLAVINHIIKFCDHISIMSTFLKNKLQEKGIQVLNLERDYSKSIRGQISTRIEAFLEMI
ncbi:MAG: 2-hydroxyacyl-CoA dehydratase [Promethearchaeota archaeon]|nr:MAG: 2-hydroxyacyl-CoA dehydratase [Candidatus Lokiarchaeota archaeon]